MAYDELASQTIGNVIHPKKYAITSGTQEQLNIEQQLIVIAIEQRNHVPAHMRKAVTALLTYGLDFLQMTRCRINSDVGPYASYCHIKWFMVWQSNTATPCRANGAVNEPGKGEQPEQPKWRAVHYQGNQ